MSILVFAEIRGGLLTKGAREAVSKARSLADELEEKVAALLIGKSAGERVHAVAKYGVDEIHVAEDPSLDPYQTETYAAVLEKVVREIEPRLVLMAHSAMAKDLAPRVAQRIGCGMAGDCVEISVKEGELRFLRPIYAGKVLASVRITTDIAFATLRPNMFPAVEREREAGVRKIEVEPVPVRAVTREEILSEDGGPELTEAEVIVSGGRGLGGPEGFELVRKVADLIGGAVGASRSAVDAGWIPQSCQVGQTGKVVSPKLYIALGISGAIQHIAGMGTSECIVAVNKDREANIFNLADYGIVGDLYDVVPIMVKRLEGMKEE